MPIVTCAALHAQVKQNYKGATVTVSAIERVKVWKDPKLGPNSPSVEADAGNDVVLAKPLASNRQESVWVYLGLATVSPQW
jgi:hypothetical protein